MKSLLPPNGTYRLSHPRVMLHCAYPLLTRPRDRRVDLASRGLP